MPTRQFDDCDGELVVTILLGGGRTQVTFAENRPIGFPLSTSMISWESHQDSPLVGAGGSEGSECLFYSRFGTPSCKSNEIVDPSES